MQAATELTGSRKAVQALRTVLSGQRERLQLTVMLLLGLVLCIPPCFNPARL